MLSARQRPRLRSAMSLASISLTRTPLHFSAESPGHAVTTPCTASLLEASCRK